MSEVLQANIFFFITGIAVIIFTLLSCVALYHVIRILKSVRKIADRIEAGSEVIAEDLAHFRSFFTEESVISRIIRKIFGGSPRSSGKKNASTKSTSKAELKIKDED